MSALPSTLQPNRDEASQFLTLLDESAERFCFRVFDDNEERKDPALAGKFEGTLDEVWPALLCKQASGCGVYVVANAGAQTNDTIYKVRAVFADTDGAPLEPILACGLEPHIIVESSPGKWHVYWLVDDLPTAAFRDVQRTIAVRFGTDKSVNDLARVMRLPGLYHLKGEPALVRIIHQSGALPYPAATILAHFAPAADTPAASTAAAPLGATVETDRHADVLKLTLLLAKSVRSGAMTRDEAFALMRQRRDAGRWSRHVPDEEIARALDGALGKGGAVDTLDSTPPPHGQLRDTVRSALAPLTPADIEAARQPHPHAFMDPAAERGLFPEGEVSVIGAPGREGKTTLMMAIATHYALGRSLGNMLPAEVRAVLVYSAEDDRAQYARKAGAQWAKLAEPDQERLLANLIVPDLHSAEMAAWREIVRVEHRQPVRGVIVETLIEETLALQSRECPPGLAIFETASTLSDAEEDNPGHKALIAALKHFAKRTGLAVVLVHHTSQNGSTKLPELDISEADIRGGTALVNNARQTHLVVNLGSAVEPFSETDARTLLRGLVAPGETDRITALICLSSSKSADPTPLFFRWDSVPPYGPRMVEVTPPHGVAGKAWRGVRGLIQGARADARTDKKAEQGRLHAAACVESVRRLTAAGKQATAAAVSADCGRSPTWAKPYLAMAVELGDLTVTPEKVPRSVRLADVYRIPADVPKPWQNDSTVPWGQSVE
jgi:hypothetical protein